MLDAGTYAGVQGGPVARAIALSLTIIGLLLVSVLVGIGASGDPFPPPDLQDPGEKGGGGGWGREKGGCRAGAL